VKIDSKPASVNVAKNTLVFSSSLAWPAAKSVICSIALRIELPRSKKAAIGNIPGLKHAHKLCALLNANELISQTWTKASGLHGI
jgi:hypothetical protein